jgi:hypothetical protein
MTEEEWLTCDDLYLLIRYLSGKLYHWGKPDTPPQASDRKMRLFACACCRRIDDLLDPGRRSLLGDIERVADGRLDRGSLLALVATLPDPEEEHLSSLPDRLDTRLLETTILDPCFGEMMEHNNAYLRACGLDPQAARAAYAAIWPAAAVTDATGDVWPKIYSHGFGRGTTQAPVAAARARAGVPPSEAGGVASWDDAVRREFREQARLLRDIVGNPFRPVAFPAAWLSPTVLALARTFYDEGAFPELPVLADALEDAGCTASVILEHLRGAGPHVRGCWALDLVLSKT